MPDFLKNLPQPKKDVVFQSITKVCKWFITSAAGISIYNSLKAKRPQFIKAEDLKWVIGGGMASGLLEGITTINNNNKFDSFVEKLNKEKLQAQVTTYIHTI